MVVDLHGAVIVDARALVVSPDRRCEEKTDGAGRFNCQVPPGPYRVSATSYDFLPYQRAQVTVRSDDHLVLTLSTVPEPERGLIVDERGARDFVGTPIQVQHHSEVVGDGGTVLIRFMTSEKRAGAVRFRGPYLMLTSETLAIYAEEMACTSPIRTCTATGSVRVEAGEEVLEGEAVEVDLVGRAIELTRSAKVLRRF